MKCNILTILILSSYFNNEVTIEINQFLERKLMVSHTSLIRQRFKWYICKLNMPLLNAPTKISTKNRFYWQQKWDDCQKRDLFVDYSIFFIIKFIVSDMKHQ